VYVSKTYYNFLFNLYHIQLMSCSKSGKTTLRLIALVSLKYGGGTKWRLPIITGFNCCIVIARNYCKNAPTVSRSGNTVNAYFLRCDAVLLRDSFQNLRSTRIFRTAGSHSSNNTKSQNLKHEYLE
jgi:hypothetical protein